MSLLRLHPDVVARLTRGHTHWTLTARPHLDHARAARDATARADARESIAPWSERAHTRREFPGRHVVDALAAPSATACGWDISLDQHAIGSRWNHPPRRVFYRRSSRPSRGRHRHLWLHKHCHACDRPARVSRTALALGSVDETRGYISRRELLRGRILPHIRAFFRVTRTHLETHSSTLKSSLMRRAVRDTFGIFSGIASSKPAPPSTALGHARTRGSSAVSGGFDLRHMFSQDL